MSLPGLALRNLWRHKRRTLTTLSALVVGIGGLVVFQGFLDQLMNGFRDSTIRGGIGHLQVAAADGYFSEGTYAPYRWALPEAEVLEQRLEALPGVRGVFPSTGFTAVASNGEKAVNLLVKAYPAGRLKFGGLEEPGAFRKDALESGQGLGPDHSDGLVLGVTAARILKAQPGSVVTLMAVLPDGGLAGRDFTVTGIYWSAGEDKIFAFADYQTALEFTNQTAPPVFHVLLDEPGRVPEAVRALGAAGAVRTWTDLAPFYVQVNSMFRGFLEVIRTILLLITLFILANTLQRIVFERMREWGTLRACGTTRGRIVALVVLEGALLGLAGALLGTAAGWGAAAAINLAGGLPYQNGAVLVHIRVIPDPSSWLGNLGPVVLTALAASLLPALRAVRPSPAEALRHP